MLVVSFANEDKLRRWVPFFRRQFVEPAYAERGLALPINIFERVRFLADPSRGVYRAYGLGRNAVWRVYGPQILWQYARWGIQGKPIRLTDDALQRGGNFVVARDGRLTLAHTGRDQSDRPAPARIIEALR